MRLTDETKIRKSYSLSLILLESNSQQKVLNFGKIFGEKYINTISAHVNVYVG